MFWSKKIKKLEESIEVLNSKINNLHSCQEYSDKVREKDIEDAIRGGSKKSYEYLYFACSNLKDNLSAYHRYLLMDQISRDESMSTNVLINNYYINLNGNEKLMLLGNITYFCSDSQYLLKVVEAVVPFSEFEMILIVNHIIKNDEFEIASVLMKNYALPQYMIDMLNSKMLINKLSGE